MIAIRSRGVALALLAGWTAMVWEVCTREHMPRLPSYAWVPWIWNLGHAPLFGGWAALAAVSLRPGRCPGPRAARDGAAAEAAADATAAGDDAAADAPTDSQGEHRVWLAAALAGVAFGALIEWRQATIPGRTASALDVVTDAVGAFGVPWALATGALLSRRAAVVLAVAGAAALLATYG